MYNSFSRVGALALTLAVLFFGIVTAASAVPTNDDFANKQLLTDTVETTTVVSSATLEASEAVGSCEPGSSPTDWSLWYEFTATASGTVKITTRLTPTPNGTNYVTVYELGATPTASNPGTEVACSSGANVNNWEGTVTSGKSYAVQVTGRSQDNSGDTLSILYSTTGTLSGTVTEAGTGNPIPGIGVTVLNTSGTALQGYAITAADGTWTATAPVGDVIVSFVDSSGVYALQYYNGKTTSIAADVLTVTTGSSQGNINAVLEGSGTFQGTITDADGNPIENAQISIYDAPNPAGPVKLGFTDANGDYSLELLPAGNYFMKFSAPGFFTEWFDEQSDYTTAATVQLQAGQTRTFDEDLAGEGSINGVVTDDLGDPVQGAVVNIYPAAASPGDAPIATGLSDPSGAYLSSNPLPPGDYKVFADTLPTLDGSYGSQWWDGKVSLGASDTVTLTSGETFLADFSLQRTVVSGRVTSSADNLPIEGVTVTLTDSNTDQVGQVLTDASGNYEFLKVQTVESPLTLTFDGTSVAHGTETQSGPISAGDVQTINLALASIPEAPVIGSGGLSATVAENVAVGTTVTTLTATDGNRTDTLTWSITGGNTGGAFTINSSSGVIKTAKALDFETTSSYSLTVQVSDGSLTDMATVAVTVTDKPEVTGPSVERLFGSNRYRTGVAVSSARFPGTSSVVFIATGGNFPDALVAAAPAGNQDAPVLLVAKNSVDSSVMAELRRLSPSKIFVIGGSAVISDSVAATLTTVAPVTRLSGSNRYSTAVDVSKEFYDPSTSSVFIATGSSFPDALVGAAPAARDGSPILLVPKGSVPSDVFAEIVRLSPSKIYILGGTAVVSDDVASTLGMIASVTRLAGSNRFGTADAVATALFPSAAGVDSAYLATAYNFPDALVAAAAAGKEGGPVLLTAKDSLTGYANTQIRRLKPADVFIIGGTAVVGDAVLNAVDW